jgi:excisionase family DNA binding protein
LLVARRLVYKYIFIKLAISEKKCLQRHFLVYNPDCAEVFSPSAKQLKHFRGKKMEEHKPSQNRIAWRPKEAAKQISISISHLRNEIRRKRIKIIRIGRAILILDEELRDYMKRNSI